MSDMLSVKGLSISFGGLKAVNNFAINIEKGQLYGLIGPNGAGKSTLGCTLMGNPNYHVTDGEIFFGGENITKEAADKRAKLGMFLSFQNPLEVPGISLSNFIRSALSARTGKNVRIWDFNKELQKAMEVLDMDPSYGFRDLNVGFSGGEKKKAEILQMLMLEPKLAILDETDSGLDVDAVRTVSQGVQLYRERVHGSLLIITHSTRILEALTVDETHVMENGVIVRNGGAELVDEINENGFGIIKAE